MSTRQIDFLFPHLPLLSGDYVTPTYKHLEQLIGKRREKCTQSKNFVCLITHVRMGPPLLALASSKGCHVFRIAHARGASLLKLKVIWVF